eukprot:TRINITY_DN2611_c0_g2_i1.p1 TRINITY_DN2611_c0_g2~~TRINITY_DN2611_c0_g2_i1.p1  ORF type:complete len:332 (+),score=12.46 TRINITY_DN2611_c0_g2_i1:137-1132(+)
MKQSQTQGQLKPSLPSKSKSMTRFKLPLPKFSTALNKSRTQLHENMECKVGKEGHVVHLNSLSQIQGKICIPLAKLRGNDKSRAYKGYSLKNLKSLIPKLTNLTATRNARAEGSATNKENSPSNNTVSSRMSSTTLPSLRNFRSNKTLDANAKRLQELNKKILRRESNQALPKRKISATNTYSHRSSSRIHLLNNFIANCEEFERESNVCENVISLKRNRLEDTVQHSKEENRIFVDLEGPVKGMLSMKPHECFYEVYKRKLAWTLARVVRNKFIYRTIENKDYKKDREESEMLLHKLVAAKYKKDNVRDSERNALYRNYVDRVMQALPYH